MPEIRAEHLATGEWPAALTGYAAQVSDDSARCWAEQSRPVSGAGWSPHLSGWSRCCVSSTQTTASPTDVRSGMSADDGLRAMGIEL